MSLADFDYCQLIKDFREYIEHDEGMPIYDIIAKGRFPDQQTLSDLALRGIKYACECQDHHIKIGQAREIIDLLEELKVLNCTNEDNPYVVDYIKLFESMGINTGRNH